MLIPASIESGLPLQNQRESPRMMFLAVVLISLAVLIPCFWQTRIQAGDLGSHVYNAWLATQIKQGKLPGLWIGRQSTNVLFDVSLTWLLEHFGANVAQRLAVCAAVLIFFWGSFAFVSVVASRRPWFLVPLLAMLAYGYVFHMGFFNFYIALGLCFWWLAIVWKCGGRTSVAGFPILLLAWLAHALPVIWVACVTAYILMVRGPSRKNQMRFLLGAGLGVVALRVALMLRYRTLWFPSQIFSMTGADQVFLADKKYLIALAGVVIVWLLLLRSMRHTAAVTTPSAKLIVHLILLNAVGVWLIPERVEISHPPGLVYISGRMSLATAVFVCALLGSATASSRQKTLVAVVSALFFVFVFVDGHRVNQTEDQLVALVRRLPPQQRVVFVPPPRKLRLDTLGHLLDRVCVGHCFSYGDYEPSTQVFRVRAAEGNPYVVTRYADSFHLEHGTYTVKQSDVPLYQIEACGPAGQNFCLRALQAGESNGPALAP